MHLTIPFGKAQIDLKVSDARFRGVVEPRPVSAIADVQEAVWHSLEAPIGTSPLRDRLRSGGRALILTVDATRPTPRPLLEPILDLCREQAIEPTICIAIGRHRPMTDPEIRAFLGEAIYTQCPIIQHDPFDDNAHIELGQTERGTPIRLNREVFNYDVVLGVGFIEPSYLAGFSGGRKLILPGIAHHTTIDSNHYLLTDPRTRIGVLDGNPLSEDAEAVARKTPFHWITYAVSGPNDEIVEVVSGDPYQAHRTACARSRDIYAVPSIHAGIVVSSPGGHPYDCDLVQGKKGIIPAREMVNPGGVLIIAAECPELWGAETVFSQWLTTMSPREVVDNVMDRAQFSLGAHGANLLAKPIVEKDVDVIFVTTSQMAEALSGSFVRATTSIGEAMHIAEQKVGRGASVALAQSARRLILEA